MNQSKRRRFSNGSTRPRCHREFGQYSKPTHLTRIKETRPKGKDQHGFQTPMRPKEAARDQVCLVRPVRRRVCRPCADREKKGGVAAATPGAERKIQSHLPARALRKGSPLLLQLTGALVAPGADGRFRRRRRCSSWGPGRRHFAKQAQSRIYFSTRVSIYQFFPLPSYKKKKGKRKKRPARKLHPLNNYLQCDSDATVRSSLQRPQSFPQPLQAGFVPCYPYWYTIYY